MYQKLNFLRFSEPGDVWRLPAKVLPSLNLREDDAVVLYCGSASAQVRVRRLKSRSNLPEDTCQISSGALHKMKIPSDFCFQIKPIGDKQFRLGPLLGILTFSGHLPGRLSYYSRYARRNINNGLLIVFSGSGIDPQQKSVSGYYYDWVNNKWIYGNFPYPDAVIDRVYPNSSASHARLEAVIGHGKIFNKRSMIDKIQFCNTLGSDPLLKQYIPETNLLKNIADIEYFLSKYGEIFLKPVNAMKGVGIVVARKQSDGIKCAYSIGKQNYTGVLPSAVEIPALLAEAAGKERPYVIQQAISRMKYEGSPFSIRTWAMKNGEGRWVMPGMFAKSAQEDSFLTNFMAGAKLVPLKALFKTIMPSLPYTKKELNQVLEYLTIQTAFCLDKTFGPLGELGIDIVLDPQGKPWLIEANGNPGNIPIFKQTDYPAWPDQVFRYPLDYATFLAGFR